LRQNSVLIVSICRNASDIHRAFAIIATLAIIAISYEVVTKVPFIIIPLVLPKGRLPMAFNNMIIISPSATTHIPIVLLRVGWLNHVGLSE